MDAPNERQFLRISNIPAHFSISDMRAFFSRYVLPQSSRPLFSTSHPCSFSHSYVETGKFEQFHLRPLPRPCSSLPPAAPAHIAGRTGLYTPINRRMPLPNCAVVVISSASTAAAFCRSFHGKKWAALPSAPPTTSGRCAIERVAVSPAVNGGRRRQGINAANELVAPESDERIEATGHAATATSAPSLPIVDLPLPPASLPRGNIGTPTSDLLSLVSRCVLPCAVLKQMGLQHFAAGGISRKFKDFNYKWPQSKGKCGPADCSGDDDNADGDGLEASWGGGSRNYTRRDRMETRELLHEEGVEDPWDKGDASGLVWYTDAQYWDALEGDLDDRTSDGLDVVGCGEGGWTRLHDAGGGDGDAGDGERYCDDSAAAERAFERFVAQGLPATLLNKWGFKPDTSGGRLPVLNANRTRTGLGWQGRGDVNVPLRRFHEEMEGEDLVGSHAAAVSGGQHAIGTVFDTVHVADVMSKRCEMWLSLRAHRLDTLSWQAWCFQDGRKRRSRFGCAKNELCAGITDAAAAFAAASITGTGHVNHLLYFACSSYGLCSASNTLAAPLSAYRRSLEMFAIRFRLFHIDSGSTNGANLSFFASASFACGKD
jgi:hypothetical protein